MQFVVGWLKISQPKFHFMQSLCFILKVTRLSNPREVRARALVEVVMRTVTRRTTLLMGVIKLWLRETQMLVLQVFFSDQSTFRFFKQKP